MASIVGSARRKGGEGKCQRGWRLFSRNPYVSSSGSSGIWDTLRSRAGVGLGAILCRGGCVSSRLPCTALGLGGSLPCPALPPLLPCSGAPLL